MRASILVVLCLAPISACSTEPCGEPGTVGLVVEVRDAITDAPAASGATAIASQGAYSETLEAHDALYLVGLVDQEGMFDLVVTKPGYQAAHETAIEIENDCGRDPAEVEIELIPE